MRGCTVRECMSSLAMGPPCKPFGNWHDNLVKRSNVGSRSMYRRSRNSTTRSCSPDSSALGFELGHEVKRLTRQSTEGGCSAQTTLRAARTTVENTHGWKRHSTRRYRRRTGDILSDWTIPHLDHAPDSFTAASISGRPASWRSSGPTCH